MKEKSTQAERDAYMKMYADASNAAKNIPPINTDVEKREKHELNVLMQFKALYGEMEFSQNIAERFNNLYYKYNEV